MTDLGKPQSPPQASPAVGPNPDAPAGKRPYQPPALTEYGSVDDLVDSGVVGPVPASVPIMG